MMKILLFILTTIVSLSVQQQNLCGHSAIFVRDPSNCHLYLFCQRDANNNTIVVHQLSCASTRGQWFLPSADGLTGTCQQSNSHCSAALSMCPQSPAQDVMIANPNDPTCSQFRPCRLPGMPYINCQPPLVFNRNTGTCGLIAAAPCANLAPPITCPPFFTGFIAGRTCYEFFLCVNGNIDGTFTCDPGLRFDEATRNCVTDVDGRCPQ